MRKSYAVVATLRMVWECPALRASSVFKEGSDDLAAYAEKCAGGFKGK